MRRSITSRVLLGLAALLMLAGGTVHSLAFRKVAAVIDASNLSKQYAAIFKGLWWSDAAVIVIVGMAYLTLALWPRLGAKAAFGVLVALPFFSAISIYSTIGNFAPAHLLIASACIALIAALVRPGCTEPQVPAESENDMGGRSPCSARNEKRRTRRLPTGSRLKTL